MNAPPRPPWVPLGVALLAVTSLMLTACGGDDAGTRDTTQPPTAEQASPPADETSGPDIAAPAPDPTTTATIEFLEGFAAGAAKAKPGDVLFVYVGQHHPT